MSASGNIRGEDAIPHENEPFFSHNFLPHPLFFFFNIYPKATTSLLTGEIIY